MPAPSVAASASASAFNRWVRAWLSALICSASRVARAETRSVSAFDRASTLEPGPLRQRLLTVTFVGGGFSGVEGFGELLSLATSLVRSYPELSPADLKFHLIEARGRILPEVSDRPGRWVVRSLEKRGAHVHLPFGEGDMDVQGVLDALDAVAFPGLVCVELSRESHRADLMIPQALQYLKSCRIPKPEA